MFSLIELSSSYYYYYFLNFKENFLFFISIPSSLTLFPIHNEKKPQKNLEKKRNAALSTKEGRIEEEEEEEKVFFFYENNKKKKKSEKLL